MAAANPPVSGNVGEGANRLAVCDAVTGEDEDHPTAAMAAGIRAVLRGGRPDFTLTYACHSPAEQRWFTARVGHVDFDQAVDQGLPVGGFQDIDGRTPEHGKWFDRAGFRV